MHCNNGLNNKLVESLVENKVAQETGDLKYLQDSMYDFVSTLKDIILGEYSPEFFNKYVDEALKLHGSNLDEFLKIPKMGLELKQALNSIDETIDTSNQEFKDNLVLLLDRFQTALDNIVFEARDAYETALDNGFEGTKQEWLEHLEGDSAYKLATLNGFPGTEKEWLDHLEGDSAYEIAVKNGYDGTQAEWLLYIRADGFIQSIQQFATNDSETKVQIPDYGTINSLQGYIKELFGNGGLPATPFTTKALMTASALVDGDYAQVTDDTVNNGLYVKTAGAWVKSEYDPLGQAKELIDRDLVVVKEALTQERVSDVAYAFTDNNGGAGVTFDTDGTINAHGIRVKGGTLSNSDKEGVAYAIVDKSGNSAFIINTDGSISISAIRDLETINGSPVGEQSGSGESKPKEIKNKPYGYTSEINGICSYGQSLAGGSTASPVISTVQKYDNLMFNSGTRPSDDGTNPAVIYTSLVPLVESVGGVNGETPLSGMTDNIKELIFNEESLAYTDMSYKFLASAPAHGGQNISSLTKGSDYYLRLFNDIKYGVLRAADTSQSYAYQATTWLQGEADYSAGTPKTIYKLILTRLIDDIAADAITLTEQTFKPDFIIGQVGSHLRYAQSAGVTSAFKADIAQAQLELSKERSDVHLACPSYQFDYSGTRNQVHMTATDERVMGAYFGLVYKRVVIDGQDWQPLQPVAITCSSKAVYITINKTDLVIDTTWVTQNTDYGFRVFDDGVQANIADVSIVNGNAIKITLESDLLGVMTVDYALFSDSPIGETGRNVGARGNIRDSQGDTIIFDPSGVNRPLHNWLVMFTFKNGEISWL